MTLTAHECLLGSVIPERREHVRAYYDYTLPFYNLFWHGRTNALHYGFAEGKATSFHEQLLNTNAFLARAASISSTDAVLDIGCGIGGSALWIARAIGAHVTGVSLSSRQVARARHLAERSGLSSLTDFVTGDIFEVSLPNEGFDVVWAIESACYLGHSNALLAHAFNLLRPGGRLIIADGFLRRSPVSISEARWLAEFEDGLVLPPLTLVEDVHARLTSNGFAGVTMWDQTVAVLPSSLRMYRMCLAGYALSTLTERCGLTPSLLTRNNRAGIVQYPLIRSGVTSYAVFRAQKPERC